MAGSTAVVTGARSRCGIGRAAAAAGWDIAALDAGGAGARETAAEITEHSGRTAAGIRCDITAETTVDAAVSTLERWAIGVDNAGTPAPFADTSNAAWERIFAVNSRWPHGTDLDQRKRAAIVAGRAGRVEDVAALIAFLCRPESGCITGATDGVNGGSHIH